MEQKKDKSATFAAIRYRRSVRSYSPKEIEDWKMDMILESARLAPSSSNTQTWRLILVKNPENKDFLANATPDRFTSFKWLKNCPIIVILCCEKSKLQRAAQMVGLNYHLVDMGIVGEHICIVAAELGIGTCWIGWINKKKIKKEFNIPASWEIVSLISMGYPEGLEQNSHDFPQIVDEMGNNSTIQKIGEPGIGNIGARRRKPIDKIVFHEKF
jgi:nitroreductase